MSEALHAGREGGCREGGWVAREVHGLLMCARCGERASGCVLSPDDPRALECRACGGCEWFHIEDERPVVDVAAGGPYR